jgi:hypothetical protein
MMVRRNPKMIIGVITLWNEDERLSRDEKVLHKSAITNITFSSDGTRMVTGDEVGIPLYPLERSGWCLENTQRTQSNLFLQQRRSYH